MFQSLSGLTLGLNLRLDAAGSSGCPDVSIPFRADTGFEQDPMARDEPNQHLLFQSLSGLTLGLNLVLAIIDTSQCHRVSIPFRADTGFERLLSLSWG